MISSQFFKKQGFGLEPLDVRILEITAKPWSDWTRITFQIRILPFRLAPTLDLSIRDKDDNVISEVTIIETPDNEIEFTMHIPKKENDNRMKLNAILKYEEYGQIDFRSQYIDP
jgi:hypothetical protein